MKASDNPRQYSSETLKAERVKTSGNAPVSRSKFGERVKWPKTIPHGESLLRGQTKELRYLIAALYSHRSTDIKDQPRYFGSPDDPDIALSCAFYAGHDLSEQEIEAGFEKNSGVFIFAILKNNHVLLNKSKRALEQNPITLDRILLQRTC